MHLLDRDRWKLEGSLANSSKCCFSILCSYLISINWSPIIKEKRGVSIVIIVGGRMKSVVVLLFFAEALGRP